MRLRLRAAAAFVPLALLAAEAGAQAPAPAPGLDRPRLGQFLEDYVARVMGPFRRADRDRNGLDAKEIAQIEARAVVAQRALRAGQVLRYDLDGDGRVTATEADAALDGEGVSPSAAIRKRRLDDLMASDTDKDGVIDIAEMLAGPPARATALIPRRGLNDLLALDPNGDGRLTGEELSRLAVEAFAAVDKDGNHYIDDGESKAASAVRLKADVSDRAATLAAARECTLPAPGADDQVIVYSTGQGAALSSVTVAGQDLPTAAGRIVIEPGERPVYLVLASNYPFLWKIEGAASRVARAVVSRSRLGGPDGGVGVAGVAKERVTFVGARECGGYFNDAASLEGEVARLVLTRALGRAPDVLAGSRMVGTVWLPGLSADEPWRTRPPAPPAGYDEQLWRQAIRNAPAGVIELKPEDVVAAGTAEAYDALPAFHGLAKLVASGAIVRSGERDFRIVQPVKRLPPGLFITRNGRFLLAPGVPVPESMHLLCVVSEVTGDRLNPRATCPR